MKKIVNSHRPVLIMQCTKDNCMCEFKTDEYKRFENWDWFFVPLNHWVYKDICPICKKKGNKL